MAIVRFGKTTISQLSAAVIILLLWLVPSVFCLYVFIPYVYEAEFFVGVTCFPDASRAINPAGQYTFIAVWTIFGGIVHL